MSKSLRIALPLDLQWPIKRHHEVYSGIQDYARTKAPHWDLIPDLFPAHWITPEDDFAGYDAVLGRITKQVADVADDAKIPCVNVWLNSPIMTKVPSVVPDYFEAGKMAGEHLLARGLRRFAGSGYRADVATRMYFKGLQAVASKYHVPLSKHYSNFNNTKSEQNWQRFVNDANGWIDSWEFPLGIATSYDDDARYLAMMCLRRSILIPEQAAIIGANDEFMHCEGSEPSLSSIDMGYYRAGYQAAELLDNLLNGGDPPSEPILAPPADLVARHSTDVYTVANKLVGRAMRFIAEHCGRKIRVAEVVAHLNCTRQKLEKQFRKAGRRSINEEIVALRIELTKRLLVSTDDSIGQIALNAGFGTAQHMRHVFRHQLGTTPTAFREAHHKGV
jgi:LacI family transcriptional regulator